MSGESTKEKKCSEDEKLVRAIRSSDWDSKKKRYSSNLFMSQGTSVSRLSVSNIKQLNKIFCDELHRPPVHEVRATGTISVMELQNIGKMFTVDKKSRPIVIWVLEKPTDKNPAHAEMFSDPKIPRSLAHQIIDNLKIRNTTPCNAIGLNNKTLLFLVMMSILILGFIFMYFII